MKRKLLFAIVALMCSVGTWAETDYTSLMPSDWTINATNPGNFQTGKEAYNTSNYAVGKIIYQSFTAPVAGIYEIKLYAVTSSTSGRGFENIYGDNIAQAYATAGSNKATVAMTVINQTGCTLVADANIRTLSVEAAEGETIEYGIENIATGGNWYTIQGISAKMKTVAEIFQAQYDEAYAIWEHSTENEDGAKATFKTYVDAMNTALTGTLAEAQTASDNLAAALVTYESKSYPVKGSGVKYDFTSKMNMAIDAWTCKQGNGPNQYGFTGATETYGVTVAGEVMYQTISGLANGEYEIHFYAVANAANGEGTAGTDLAYVYANDQTLDIEVITQNSCTPSDYERTLTVMVKDGTIKYGITNKAVAGNWNLCKNVALYMTGAPDLSDYYDAIAEQLTKANTLKSENMKADVLSALQAAIDATEGYESIAVTSTLETLSNNLITANNNATTSVENYTLAKTILDAASTLDAAGKASYAANETVAAIQTAYDAKTLVAVSSEQETACTNALRAAAKAQTTAGADMTLAIVNPEINGIDGWTVERPKGGNGPLLNNVSMEYWAGNANPRADASFDYYQVITDLPAGTYTISAEMYNSLNSEEGATFNASSGVYGSSDTEEKYKLVDVDGTVLTKYTIEPIIVDEGTLRIGVKSVEKMGARWFVADNFKLTYVGAVTAADYKELLAEAIDDAEAIVDAKANVGTGVFQIPESAVTTLSSAITTQQSVYDNSEATIEEVQNATAGMNDAIEAYGNATLNAPVAGTRYYLEVATSGHAKENNAIVVSLGEPIDNNKTGYGFAANASPAAHVAGAYIFTPVEGKVNHYNISVERPEGTVYLTYGSLNSSAAGWATQQIQGTTDESAKGEFKIVATSNANVFNIVNTVFDGADNYIDCQDGGALYTDTNIDTKDFKLAEASQATVEVKVDADKFATRIFPFAPGTIDGITFYTATVNGEKVELEEVETPEANKPYILKASNDVNTTVSGWGTATADSYIEGALTGVYTAATINANANNYVLQTQGGIQAFYKVNAAFTATAYRAYLTAPAESNGVKALYFDFGGETAIKGVEAADMQNATIYNLAGQRVNKAQKGIYVVNGKKVAVK